MIRRWWPRGWDGSSCSPSRSRSRSPHCWFVIRTRPWPTTILRNRTAQKAVARHNRWSSTRGLTEIEAIRIGLPFRQRLRLPDLTCGEVDLRRHSDPRPGRPVAPGDRERLGISACRVSGAGCCRRRRFSRPDQRGGTAVRRQVFADRVSQRSRQPKRRPGARFDAVCRVLGR
jgi:hypothetical protein